MLTVPKLILASISIVIILLFSKVRSKYAYVMCEEKSLYFK